MPLVACPDCGHVLSDRAPACVSCGCPLEAAEPGPRVKPCMRCKGPMKPGATIQERTEGGTILLALGVFLTLLGLLFWATAILGVLMIIAGALWTHSVRLYHCARCTGAARRVPIG